MLTCTLYLTGMKATSSKESHSHSTGEGSKQTPSTVIVNASSTSKVVVAVTYNNIQLVDVIVETLLAQKQQLASTNHKLMITARDPVPVEISHGMAIRREDLRNAHAETGVT